MSEIKAITATEARALMPTPLNTIIKYVTNRIKEEAKANNTRAYYGLDNTEQSYAYRVIGHFEKAGFAVNYDEARHNITISW